MQTVFVQKPKTTREDYNIMYQMGKSAKKGEIGIEIECEGNKFQKTNLPGVWECHQDGSLRGEDNAEYVLSRPIMFDGVQSQIDQLWQMFEDFGTVLDDSNRTSVHIHLNMLTFHLNRLCSFFGLYFIVEELLTQWCGEHRVGNLFCLRARDATGIITTLKGFLQNDACYDISQGFHYAGLNANALHKFGSIEIRTLRGVMDKQTILDWVGVLRRLYELSKEYDDPRRVVETFSGDGPMAFLQNILGDYTGVILNEIKWSESQIKASVHHGVRLAQDLCYCRDWSEYNPTEVRTDPFGRIRPKKSLSSAQLVDEYLNQQAILSSSPAGPSPYVQPEHEDEDDDYYEPEPDIEFDDSWDPEN